MSAEPLPATLVVCDTCNATVEEKTINGQTGGEIFAGHVEAVAAAEPLVTVKRFSCLMNCKRHCSAAISSPGKVAYVLGDFEPTREAAEALVEHAAKYAVHENGVVPYRQWPAGVKGHFVSRVPTPAMLSDQDG